jgi:hypothetical protein
MSQLGQKLRFDPLPATSGLPRITDIHRPALLVRLVPRTEVVALIRLPYRREGQPIRVSTGQATLRS